MLGVCKRLQSPTIWRAVHRSDQFSVVSLVVVDHVVWCLCMDLISSQHLARLVVVDHVVWCFLLIFQSKNVKGAESVKVVVRCRPMDQKEIKDGHERCVPAVGHRPYWIWEVSHKHRQRYFLTYIYLFYLFIYFKCSFLSPCAKRFLIFLCFVLWWTIKIDLIWNYFSTFWLNRRDNWLLTPSRPQSSLLCRYG